MFSLRTLVPLLVIATLLAVPAEATTTYYVGSSTEASFNTALGGLTLLDPALTFSSGDLSAGVGILNASGTGIDFLGFDTAFSGCCGPLGFTVSSGTLTAANAAELVEVTFPASGIYAFAIHITMTAGTNVNWCLSSTPSLTACDNSVLNSTTSNIQFFGIVSSAPITAPLYIRPQSGIPTLVLTNFEAFGPSQVPEPRTMLLVGLGLIILPLLRRRQRAG
jgi:hypothetical protein